MGVYLHYQAMPTGSRLLQRLRTERPFCVMYASVIHHPAGPFDTDRFSSDEREELLHNIATRERVFVSRAEVDHRYAELRRELDAAAAEHPGLRQRSAYFKLIDTDAELERFLTGLGEQNPRESAQRIVYGAERLGSDGFKSANVTPYWVPADDVARGAAMLGRIDLPRDVWPGREIHELRHVYETAAAHGEGIVVA